MCDIPIGIQTYKSSLSARHNGQLGESLYEAFLQEFPPRPSLPLREGGAAAAAETLPAAMFTLVNFARRSVVNQGEMAPGALPRAGPRAPGVTLSHTSEPLLD